MIFPRSGRRRRRRRRRRRGRKGSFHWFVVRLTKKSSLLCSHFYRKKVDIFLVVPLVTSQLQCLTHNPQVCMLSYTKSFYTNFWYVMCCEVVCDY